MHRITFYMLIYVTVIPHPLQTGDTEMILRYKFESRSGRVVQHYAIKFVSDMRQVGGFLRVLRFPPAIKLTATI
jgi:hypothetical protein